MFRVIYNALYVTNIFIKIADKQVLRQLSLYTRVKCFLTIDFMGYKHPYYYIWWSVGTYKAAPEKNANSGLFCISQWAKCFLFDNWLWWLHASVFKYLMVSSILYSCAWNSRKTVGCFVQADELIHLFLCRVFSFLPIDLTGYKNPH